jgi:hypothetical protein
MPAIGSENWEEKRPFPGSSQRETRMPMAQKPGFPGFFSLLRPIVTLWQQWGEFFRVRQGLRSGTTLFTARKAALQGRIER